MQWEITEPKQKKDATAMNKKTKYHTEKDLKLFSAYYQIMPFYTVDKNDLLFD